MGIIPDPNPNILSEILKLVRSPRVQYLGGQFNRALGNSTGPFRSYSPQGSSRTGASPRLNSGYSNAGAAIGSVLSQLGGSPQQQQQDPLTTLYEQLLNRLQQPVSMPTGIDTKDLLRQVQAALNPIYDQRVHAAQSQSDKGRAEVKDMYRALSNDYERLAPEQVAQAKEAQKQVEALYGQLRSNIEGSYSRVSNEQADLFQQLGIQDALPSVLQDQAPAVTDALTAASENQAQQQQRYQDIGQMDASYYREGSPIATMAGNEIQTNMLDELTNYLNQVEAERTSGIQTAYMDQLGQAQNQLSQQQQSAQNEASRRQEMIWQMLQSQLQGRQQQQQQALTPDTFMSQLPPQIQQAVAGAFTQLQRSPEAVYGKVEDKRNPVPGTFVEITPQWYMAQADEMLRRGQLDPVIHQALLMYLQLYFGSGK